MISANTFDIQCCFTIFTRLSHDTVLSGLMISTANVTVMYGPASSAEPVSGAIPGVSTDQTRWDRNQGYVVM